MTKAEQVKIENQGIEAYLASQVRAVDCVLEEWLPAETVNPSSIHKAMRYSLFAGGKRIRPILAMAAARAVCDSPDGIENAAATLELVHTYSLIHDDLPALDNDDLRRGRPTCHKVFGEAMAILTGDALLTLAFEVLSRLRHIDAERKIRLVEELSRASGTVGGMIGGQVNDIEGKRNAPAPYCWNRSTAQRRERCCVLAFAWVQSTPQPPLGTDGAIRIWRAHWAGIPDYR